jgi:Putative peptidoglycan binding domain
MAERPGGGPRSRPARWRRPGVLAAAGILVVAGAVTGTTAALSARRAPAGRGGGVRVATARVVRTDLTNTVQVGGSLGYAGAFAVVGERAGTAYTALPQPGQVVRRGQRLYEVDGSPVMLFYGARPEWRALSLGVADGPDVAQLDANLIALGYAGRADLTVSDTFSYATFYAVERWQAARGLPVTGTVAAGQVAYAPGALRVTTVTPSLGAPAQPGATVLTATSPTVVVKAGLPVAQEYLVKRGDQVSVTLPDGTATASGVVASVSRVATSGPSDGSSSGPSADGPPGGGGSGGGGATVQLVVRLAHPHAAGNLDQAPVTVNIVSARARNVLAVPVNALVALAGGGYAVEVPDQGGLRLVGVRTGLFGSTLVQVTGAGLAPGTPVEVPAS